MNLRFSFSSTNKNPVYNSFFLFAMIIDETLSVLPFL